jgi:hypothetical protein
MRILFLLLEKNIWLFKSNTANLFAFFVESTSHHQVYIYSCFSTRNAINQYLFIHDGDENTKLFNFSTFIRNVFEMIKKRVFYTNERAVNQILQHSSV